MFEEGDQHSIKHSSRGTALPETSRSFLTATFFFLPHTSPPPAFFSFFLFWWQQTAASNRRRQTRGGREVQERWRRLGNFLRKSLETAPRGNSGGSSLAASSGEDGRTDGYTTHLTSVSAQGRRNAGKSHFATVRSTWRFC